MREQVDVWAEDIIIPTYPAGKPEKNPMFLEKRVYQGSSGVVYPHPVIEKIHDEKIDRAYHAVFIENKYIKIMILPELGGRIQMAYDKIRQRHFVYYNRVIKPALVGLTGPWISGGIEFNWPQHHRPSTFEPVDYTIEANPDGSKTVWINEVERMFHTKGRAGFTVYPGRAYLEIKGKLYNRTPFPQTFLWWANPAVKVNDHYQSVFPPDVHAVFDHGKRDVSSFPVAKAVYYKVDYSPGTDISMYKNIPVPTSFMAVKSKYDFIGGYEHDAKAGLLHVADHHLSPGKKQWTWGHGEFGQAWDRNLTDEDGPYIELMTGVYTDNQPDFSWLQPYEEKTFAQYFMPYAEVGMVKNATKDVVAGIEFTGHNAEIKLYVTAVYPNVKIALLNNGQELFSEICSCSPENVYTRIISFPQPPVPEETILVITNLQTSMLLVSYIKEKETGYEIPSPAHAAKRPVDIESNEQLYLTGLHIEQYRHATYNAKDYYEEALRRDEKDIRNNNALGLWYLRKGQFKKAELFFEKEIDTLTGHNPNPYDGEPYYNLGIALKMQGKTDKAYEALYKAVWSEAWQHAGYLQLAQIACLRNECEKAFELIESSLFKNYHSHTARHAKTFILRKLGRHEEAVAFAKASIEIDVFNYGCLYENYLLSTAKNEKVEAGEYLHQLKTTSRNWEHNFIAYSCDYAAAGLYEEAIGLLEMYRYDNNEPYPMVLYYLGYYTHKLEEKEKALEYFREAASLKTDYCFPNKIEDIDTLQTAIILNPADAKAYYYLANLWYDKRQYEEAITYWEKSIAINSNFPVAYRNLSLAYYNKQNNSAKALEALEKAFSLDETDGRILMELDQLYRKLNKPHNQRLNFLEKHIDIVRSRDDLYLEYITLYNQLGQYQKAKELLASYKFHPWEGGEGKVVGQYLICHLELTKMAIELHRYDEALSLLHDAEHYSLNLGEGKLFGAQENDIHYLRGIVFEKQSKYQSSNEQFFLATQGISEPVQALFYNDPQPDKIFYQGLAWLKLHETERAVEMFQKLINFGRAHIHDSISIDYFAVSLPDMLVFDTDLDERNKIHCLYLQGLGNLGLGNAYREEADNYFNEVLKLDINHQGAIIHLQVKNFEWLISQL